MTAVQKLTDQIYDAANVNVSYSDAEDAVAVTTGYTAPLETLVARAQAFAADVGQLSSRTIGASRQLTARQLAADISAFLAQWA